MSKESILLSDVSIKGNITETDKVTLDCKVSGDINANEVITHPNSLIKGNIKSKKVTVGGEIKGNLNSDHIKIISSGNVEGSLNQKTLSIESGAKLKIKAETYK